MIDTTGGYALVEVHGNDGTSHKTVARHLVEKEGHVVKDVYPSGIRCRHGYMVWTVEVEEGKE